MDKTFTFIYEGQLHITTQPIPTLKSKYSYTNAIPVSSVDWNVQLEYIACSKALIPCKNINDMPVLENATVSKDGDIFIVEGTIYSDGVSYVVTMDTNGITISETINESASQKDTVAVAEVPEMPISSETSPAVHTSSASVSKVHFGMPVRTPRMSFKQPSHTVHRVDVPTETVKLPTPIEVRTEPVTVESVKRASFSKDEILMLAEHFTTLARLYQPVVAETVQVREQPLPVQPAQPTPGLSFGQTELPNLTASSPGVIPVTPIPVKESPITKEVPVGEMSSYSEVLATIPLQLLTNCSAYTATRVNKDEVLAGGAVYCTTSGWSHEGDWYAIDEVATVTRHFLDACTEKYYAIPLADIKAWVNANC